jgi:hypothetical protein
VFDRVLAKVGGRKWWTAVTGRAKVQRIYKLASSSGSKVRARGSTLPKLLYATASKLEYWLLFSCNL